MDGGDPAAIRGRGHRLGHMSHGQNKSHASGDIIGLRISKFRTSKKKKNSANEQKAVLETRVTLSSDDVTLASGGDDWHPRVVMFRVQGLDVLPPPPSLPPQYTELRRTVTSSDG